MATNVAVRGDRYDTLAKETDHAQVLVVSKLPSVRESLAVVLTEEGYSTSVTRNNDEALDEVSRSTVDALVVEIGDSAPAELLPSLRQGTDAPIIALVAPDDRAARDACVAAFDAGADDCAVWRDGTADTGPFPELTRRLT